MRGRGGDDTYFVDNFDANGGDVVVVNNHDGIDTIFSSVSYSLPPNVENLTLTGTANTAGFGNGNGDTIIGNSGDNLLLGQTMRGGAGDDYYEVVGSNVIVVENVGEGTDTVNTGRSYTLPPNVENIIFGGDANVTGTGNELDNTIIGNARNNFINGGIGADTMSGRSGDDTYVVDNPGDAVIETDNDGIDTVRNWIGYTLPDNVENLTLFGIGNIAGTGNALDNVIIGNSGNNTLARPRRRR